jgi:hypothetical protein
MYPAIRDAKLMIGLAVGGSVGNWFFKFFPPTPTQITIAIMQGIHTYRRVACIILYPVIVMTMEMRAMITIPDYDALDTELQYCTQMIVTYICRE